MTTSTDTRAWFFVKGAKGLSGTPKGGLAWAFSKRWFFNISAESLKCGSWVIPIADIQRAILYEGPKSFMGAVRILEVQTSDTSYQFAFNPGSDVSSKLPFTPEIVELKLSAGTTFVRIAIRVILLAVLVDYAYRTWA